MIPQKIFLNSRTWFLKLFFLIIFINIYIIIGNVPTLVLDDGTVLNEGAATLQYIADQVSTIYLLSIYPKDTTKRVLTRIPARETLPYTNIHYFTLPEDYTTYEHIYFHEKVSWVLNIRNPKIYLS